MNLVAEYVSNGHPDRLCDNIVKNIVDYVISKDKDALCGLECAVHTNKVFIDGRIAAGKEKTVITKNKIKDIIKKVYVNAGYDKTEYTNPRCNNKDWHPYPNELRIYMDICIEKLSDEERDLRKYSDDQNIVNGYAINNPKSDYLPVAHYVALKLGNEYKLNISRYEDIFGPDFKILVQLKKEDNTYKWERLTLSIQHNKKRNFKNLYKICKDEIDSILWHFRSTELASLSSIDDDHFYLNGAGDFIIGGPEGDNGLSGKKLCVDFYGPSIPIGGGAIYGKDPHKIDVCGAFKAREFALKLVKEHNFYSVFTTLAWSPGEKEPYLIEAYEIDEFGTKLLIDKSLYPPKDSFSIESIFNDLKLSERKIPSISDFK